eukprot:NODE_1797_length_1377_cov_32.420800_g1705_i0.p1 GENE.NODE_1797_length_1377_cov_32.420800_g1705_i0~~NODE_1797_length_1377_cov_32.420800_g1705_i0.p1  ORF type:complete len:453 (+),score=83.91 NODE_1797_length_1377_cov_32.420800_g1705_i0:1-1359(+)
MLNANAPYYQFSGDSIQQHCSPRSQSPPKAHRWIVLLIGGFLLFGRNCAYDTHASLRPQVISALYITPVQFNGLYTFTHLPNVFMCAVAGLWVDRCGLPLPLLALAGCVVVGQGMVLVGMATGHYPWLLMGRFLFGFGGESLTIIQSKVLSLWFHGDAFMLALALNWGMDRSGSLLSTWAPPLLCAHSSLLFTYGVYFLLTLVCFCCALVLCLLNHGQRPDPEAAIVPPDVCRLPWVYWAVCAVLCLGYSAMLPFHVVESTFLQTHWYPHDSVGAGRAMALSELLSTLTLPLLLYTTHTSGRHGWLGTLAAGVTCGAYLVFYVHPTVSPLPCLIALKVAQASFTAIIWPTIGIVASPYMWGTAYALASALMNLSCGSITLCAGVLCWEGLFQLLVGISAVACLLLLALNVWDHRTHRILNLSERMREERCYMSGSEINAEIEYLLSTSLTAK